MEKFPAIKTRGVVISCVSCDLIYYTDTCVKVHYLFLSVVKHI